MMDNTTLLSLHLERRPRTVVIFLWVTVTRDSDFVGGEGAKPRAARNEGASPRNKK